MTEDNKTPAPAPEPAPAPAAAAPEPAPAPAEPPKEQTVPLSRLQAVIAQKAESERAKEALLRELKLANDTLAEHKALSTRPGAVDPNAQPAARTAAERAPSPQELQALVAEEATRQNFNERCNTAAVAGREAHADFDKVVLGDLTSISPVVGQNGRPVLPVTLLEAALETGQASEVLYALGQDVNEASRIMGLRPVAQAVELAKFANKLQTAAAPAEPEVDDDGKPIIPNVSRAPAPIKPRVKQSAVKPSWKAEDTDNFSTEEWIRQREKQVKENRTSR
jgi:hypothetical protein